MWAAIRACKRSRNIKFGDNYCQISHQWPALRIFRNIQRSFNMKIGITTSSFARFSIEPLKLLERAGFYYEINPYERKLSEEEAKMFLSDCVGVVAGTELLSRSVIESLTGLNVISRCGVGIDNVDPEAAREHGVAVCNTPYGPTLAVAELTLGLALNLLREVNCMDRELRGGKWKKRMGFTLFGKRVGIIGFGRIGKAVAERFQAMGAEIAFCDPVVTTDEYPRKTLEDLLPWSEILTLHCSKPEGPRPLLGATELSLLSRGAWLINCTRGGIVEENALCKALKSGHLQGAAIDVFEAEPYKGPLQDLGNIILTPHVGSYARESRIQMETDAVKNLIKVIKNSEAKQE